MSQSRLTPQTSYAKGAKTAPLTTQTIGQCFDSIVKQHPNQPALVSVHQSIRWTYLEFQAEVDRLATGLLALGVEPGDRVGIWSPNCAEWYLTQLATAKMGAIMVCINPAYQTY